MHLAYLGVGTDGHAADLHVRIDASAGWVPTAHLLPEITTIGQALEHRAQLARRLSTAGSATPPDGRPVTGCLDIGAKVIAVGLNFASHAAEIGAEIPDRPFCFPKLPSAVATPQSRLQRPGHVTAELDYEVELAVFVGARTRDATVEESQRNIAGYAVANDVSAREWQTSGPWTNWVRAKGLDGFLPLGPWITVTDDGAPPQPQGALSSEVNGEERQRAKISELLFSPAEMVSYVSQGVTLRPGDVILSGTPAGVGHARSEQRFLRDGDTVVCRVDGLGEITTTVVG